MSTPPGSDPDLPARLRALAIVTEGEQRTGRAWFRSLTRFLDRVRPAVTGGDGIDPGRVSDYEAFWTAEVDVEVLPTVRRTLREAFRRVTGVGEPERDPYVSAYLNAAGNRMLNVPNEVYALVVAEVERGIREGEGIREVTEGVNLILTATGTDYWPNRARTVARTETMGAVNAGVFRGAQVDAERRGDLAPFKMWLSTIDDRTRPTHVAADKQRTLLSEPFVVGGANLLFPGDPTGPADEVINCVTGDARITGAGVTRAYRTLYSGPAVSLTRGGLIMTVTANHPVLTERGWVPAREIQVGDHVVGGHFGGQFPRSEPHIQAAVPTAEEIFDALRVTGDAHRVLRGAVNFHGDHAASDVDVVSADRPLSFGVDPALSEVFDQLCLTYAHAPTAGGGPEFHLGVTPLDAPHGVVSFADLVCALRSVHASPLDSLSLGLAALDTGLLESAVNDGTADAVAFGQSVSGLTSLVTLDEVTGVEIDSFHGYVYSFETESGIYISDTTTSHNCRCTMIPIVLGETLDWTDRQNARGTDT